MYLTDITHLSYHGDRTPCIKESQPHLPLTDRTGFQPLQHQQHQQQRPMPLNSSDGNQTTSAFTSKLTPAADICVGLAIFSIGMLSYLFSLFLLYLENKSAVDYFFDKLNSHL